MSIEIAKKHLEKLGLGDRVMEFEVSSATVELAAQAVGVEGARIAKTLSFYLGESCLLVLAAGDARVDNKKFKARFAQKARMLAPEDALRMTGHAVGGVCPFGVPEDVEVYTDVSLKRFDTVYPAAGNDRSAVRLSCEELYTAAGSRGWVDVCKDWDRPE